MLQKELKISNIFEIFSIFLNHSLQNIESWIAKFKIQELFMFSVLKSEAEDLKLLAESDYKKIQEYKVESLALRAGLIADLAAQETKVCDWRFHKKDFKLYYRKLCWIIFDHS